MIEVKAPMKFTPSDKFSIYLAGPVEVGVGPAWRQDVCEALKEYDIIILNPQRRIEDMDDLIPNSFDNPEYVDQIQWALDAMEHADLIAMNFASLSLYSLHGLGRYSKSGKLVVCCPKEFYRRGNVEILCSYHRIPMVSTFENLLEFIKCAVEYGLTVGDLK